MKPINDFVFKSISWLFFQFYRHVALPFALVALYIVKPFLNNKLKFMIEERSMPNWPEVTASPIWIHASSGEIEYAKSVIRQLKEKWPQQPILLTYFSPSAKKLLQNISGIDVIIPLPWDTEKQITKFLKHFHPKLLLISRTDAWPECVYQAKQFNIPSFLFSSTFSSNSSRNQFFTQFLTSFAFNQLTEIYTVTDEDTFNIKNLHIDTPIYALGDTRFDQVIYRLKHKQLTKNILNPKQNFSKLVFISGSTWPEDEEILFSSISDFLKHGNRIILAPHEISENHIANIEKKITSLGYTSHRYSTSTGWNLHQILILDQIGILAELYEWGDFAFVGGSFKSRVHSVMEPLAVGLPVIVGPHHTNNREALHFTNVIIRSHSNQQLTAVCVANNSQDFTDQIQNISTSLQEDSQIHLRIKSKVLELCGATDKIIQKISSRI